MDLVPHAVSSPVTARTATGDRSRPAERGAAKAPLALLPLLAACASYEERPLVPRDELGRLQAVTLEGIRIEPAAETRPASAPAAFDPSDGLDEREVVAVALTLNPTLRAKRLEIGEPQALLIAAGQWPNPELGVSVRPGIDGAPSTAVGLDPLFELLRPGERSARTALAEARVDAVRAEIAAEEYRVATDARRARLAILAAEQSLRFLEQEAALRDEALALVRRRQELGEGTALDVLLVELEQAEVQRALRFARADEGRLRRALLAALGLPPTFSLRLADSGRPLAFSLADDVPDEDLDARVLAGRLDLRTLQARYAAVEQELRLAVARQWPRLAIGPSFDHDADRTKSLGLGASIELPLFTRNQAEIAEKEAARSRARAEYVARLHRARTEAFEAREAVRRLRAEVELQRREVIPVVERTESLFESALRAREITIVEWLTARGRALAVRRDLLRTLVDYAGSVVELEAALGAAANPNIAPSQPES